MPDLNTIDLDALLNSEPCLCVTGHRCAEMRWLSRQAERWGLVYAYQPRNASVEERYGRAVVARENHRREAMG